MGRPKLEFARSENLHLRLTKFELEEISALAKKLNLTKTETVLRGIKFPNLKEVTLARFKKFRSVKKFSALKFFPAKIL